MNCKSSDEGWTEIALFRHKSQQQKKISDSGTMNNDLCVAINFGLQGS